MTTYVTRRTTPITPARVAIWAGGLALLIAYVALGVTDMLGHALGHPLIATAVNGWAMTAIGSSGACLATAAAAGWVIRRLEARDTTRATEHAESITLAERERRQTLALVADIGARLAAMEAAQISREDEWHTQVLARLMGIEAEQITREAARDQDWAQRLAELAEALRAERERRERAVFDAGVEAGQAMSSIAGRQHR